MAPATEERIDNEKENVSGNREESEKSRLSESGGGCGRGLLDYR